MSTPPSLHHSLLRPCVLHILRAAGYHSTRPSVLDALTDLAARYMILLVESTAIHATIDHTELEITIQDVRMAMQDCGTLMPEKTLEEQAYDEEEDTRGMDAFLEWATGKGNQEIQRVALEGTDGSKDDYLTVLKKKHSAEEDSRYNGTLLGKPVEIRSIKIEGADISSMKEWTEKLKKDSLDRLSSALSSRRQSSILSSLGDQDMEDMEF